MQPPLQWEGSLPRTHNNNAAIPAVGREPPKKPVVDLGLLASKNMRKDIAGF